MFKTIRPTAFSEMATNAFMLLSDFDPTNFNPTNGIDASKIIGATTNGVNFSDKPEFTDFAADVDNADKNLMEFKRKKNGETRISGNLVTINANMLERLMAGADVEGNHLVPRENLKTSDFMTLWALADYGENGLLCIKMNRVLNTSGFSANTTDDNKTQFAFDFLAHKTLSDLTSPTYEVWLWEPEESNEDEEEKQP